MFFFVLTLCVKRFQLVTRDYVSCANIITTTTDDDNNKRVDMFFFCFDFVCETIDDALDDDVSAAHVCEYCDNNDDKKEKENERI